MYCLDASVITNSIIKSEEHHEYSKRLLLKIKNQNIPVVLPEIIVPEVASALSAGARNSKLPLQFVAELRKIPNFVFVPVDAEVSNLAARFAAEKHLRGADAIYVAIASIFNVSLITLDKRQKEKAAGTVKTATPMEELKKL
ncbi:MAG: type II toxin-antitoxin system VapC family toxin [Nanoarchaeota archaeon]